MTAAPTAHNDINSSTMDTLSDELHCMIAKYLGEELMGAANYRLINKRCANIGARYLFDHFLCRPSTQCQERLLHLQQANLNRHIRIIDWTSDPDSAHYEDETNLGLRVRTFRDIVLASPNVTTLAALQLRYETFFDQNYSLDFAEACKNLTSLDLRFFASEADFKACLYDGAKRAEFQRNLKEVLVHTRYLTVLGLCLGHAKYWRNELIWVRLCLSHIIPTDKIWAKLQVLELCCVGIMEHDFVQLLAAHSGTLMSVYLEESLLLDPNGAISEDSSWHRYGTVMPKWKKLAWRSVFAQFEAMEKVTEVAVDEIAYPSQVDDEEKMTLRSRSGRNISVKTNLKMFLEEEEI
jgi:hypothetical protein